MKKINFLLLLVFSFIKAHAQDTTKPLTFSGYVEIYYSYDFGNPSNHIRPASPLTAGDAPFLFYSYNRANEVNLNSTRFSTGRNSF